MLEHSLQLRLGPARAVQRAQLLLVQHELLRQLGVDARLVGQPRLHALPRVCPLGVLFPRLAQLGLQRVEPLLLQRDRLLLGRADALHPPLLLLQLLEHRVLLALRRLHRAMQLAHRRLLPPLPLALVRQLRLHIG
jgi:hypothetical protein